jgi:hypothetical protein
MKSRWWLIGLCLALLVAFLSPLASPHPDGLERVAENDGFISRARGPWYTLIPDYLFPGIANEAVATIIAGIVGVVMVFALTYFLTRIIARRRPTGERQT